MELWERSAALAVLDGLVAETARAGRVALVAGEAGLGKSSLVSEFSRQLGIRGRVLWGGCDPLVTPRALGPLHDIARQVGGQLAARVSAAGQPDEMFAAFLDEVAGPRQRSRPVVVIEDAHWADAGTLDWLVFLARRIERLPALLLVTYRDDEVGRDHPLRRALAALPAAAVRRIPLEPLSEACVVAAAQRAGQDADSVRRLAGGNPLLVTELLKAGRPGVPDAVQDLVLARLASLPPTSRDFAQLVAVVPTRADPPLLVGSDGEIEDCLDAGVLVPSGHGVAYRHELLRTAVEASLSPRQRVALHRRVLALLDGVAGIDPGRLVHHARGAGDGDATLRYGRIAGLGAARQGAHREATRHLAAAAAHAARLPAAEQLELLEEYAQEAYFAGELEDALATRRRTAQWRSERGEVEAVSENLRWISRLSWFTGRVADARAAADEAVSVLAGRPESVALARAFANQSRVHLTTHDFETAIGWGQRARELAERVGDPATAGHAAVTVATARIAQEETRGLEELEGLFRRAAEQGDNELASRALNNLALVMADERAEYGAAGPLMDRALSFSRDRDMVGMYHMVKGSRAKLRLERGDWAGAEDDAEQTLAESGMSGVNAVLPLVVRGRIQTARGDERAHATLMEAARAAEGVGDVPMLVPVADGLAEYHLLAGDPERAVEAARRGIDQAKSTAAHPILVGRLAWRLSQAGVDAAELPTPIATPFRLMIEGRWAEAAAEWERRDGRYLQAAALAAGDEAAALAALATYQRLGAVRLAEAIRSDLRRRGVARIPRGPRAATAAQPAGLTPRQVDVLLLLAEGLSNAEISSRLTLSAKTVDHHVSAVLAKLGVSSRGQAVAAARRLGIASTDA